MQNCKIPKKLGKCRNYWSKPVMITATKASNIKALPIIVNLLYYNNG